MALGLGPSLLASNRHVLGPTRAGEQRASAKTLGGARHGLEFGPTSAQCAPWAAAKSQHLSSSNRHIAVATPLAQALGNNGFHGRSWTVPPHQKIGSVLFGVVL